MKRLFVLALILLSLGMIMCKKSATKNNNTVICTTCSGTPVAHTPDFSDTYYYLPTAFTPNGDGLNDVFKLFFKGLDTLASTITVWNLSGTKVFDGKLTTRWDGIDLSGARCAAGKYPVYLDLKTYAGITVTVCACVNILSYTGNCLKTNGTPYYFPDQLDTTGFVFPTNEILCP